MDPRASPRTIDTFARDASATRQWPELRFDLPELRYPARLNCAAELRHVPPDGRPARSAPRRAAWTYGELRAARGPARTPPHRRPRGSSPATGAAARAPPPRVLAAAGWRAEAGAIAVHVPAQAAPARAEPVCESAEVRHALCDVRSVDDSPGPACRLSLTAYGGDSPATC
ncbi:hypothetical protein GCM10023238_07100 [Streptomyces heliomycini]